ncbi:helix-turn-helix domain-containing protein [Sphaerotilus montanus]|jgi:transcriptional regulator with XRE-family HTH domain|uniref:helix-turn-helix domain-containing protein n=1 Tax=Sphaerotilus montanus TaxID=522889 RepID=UPI003FA21B6B
MLKSIHTRHNDIFLDMLRRSRKARKLRQADLATRLGRGQSVISKVEQGERRLDVIELRAWLNALEIDFADFMNELNHRLEGMPIPDAMFRARHASRDRQSDRS